ASNPKSIPEKIDGAKDAPKIDGPTDMQPSIDPTKPKPRPMLTAQAQVRPAILADQPIGAPGIGPVAYDARWSNYGAYLQRLINSVQIEWERILVESKVAPPSNSTVTIKFVLDSDGKIARIVTVENHSSDLG